MSMTSEQIWECRRIAPDQTYWFWAASRPSRRSVELLDLDEAWVTVAASHWGAPRLDLPEPIDLCAAAFTTREAALAYRKAAPEGTSAAAQRWLVQAEWKGGVAFARRGEFEHVPAE